MALVARTSVDPAKLAGALRTAVTGVDPDLPVYGLESLEEMLNRVLAGVRSMAKILGMLAALALLLAAIGIYGSIAYLVGRRTREIGVRLALGATPAAVFRAVLGSGLALMFAGLAAGLPCAFALMPVLRRFLEGVEPYDLVIFAALSAILFGVAVVACLVPARRAMRLDPVAALRLE